MNLIGSVLIPVACTLLSVCVNIVLAQAEILPRSALEGNPPTVLDVSVQLIFVSVGAIASVALTEDEGLRARALWPMLYCFAALCLVLALQVAAKQQWGWVLNREGLLRVWLPDFIGAATIGLTLWQVQRRDAAAEQEG